MCLISTEIESVSNTKILVAPNNNNTRQLVIYSNNVNNVSESNAMVLPVPLPQTIKFIDLSKYKEIFEDCAKCFYNPIKSLNYSNSISTNSFNTRDDKPLQVFEVGSYKVSLALNLEQISRVDVRVFKLSQGLKQILETYYYQPYWGFIICKLNSGPESYHPFAYSHQIIDSKVYIPTRHYHQEVQWADINGWALGTHLDPKQNPINMKSWSTDNIDMSPMFRVEQFGKTSPEVNGWANMVGQTNIVNGLVDDVDGVNNDYSTNQFNTPQGKFNYPSSNIPLYQKSNSSQLESNSIALMSSRYDNLKKLNDSNYNKKHNANNNHNHNQNPQESTSFAYKNIADDWSHSIYLLNLNPSLNNNIRQMNSCKEIWDRKTLFDPDKINFDFGYCQSFIKLKIEGTHPNIDLVIPISK
jgi:hypothetical protein